MRVNASGRRQSRSASCWTSIWRRRERVTTSPTQLTIGGLAEAVVGAVEASSYLLIEALATRIADICLTESKVEAVEVTLRKPGALPIADYAAGDNPAKAADREVSVWGRQPHLDEQVKARMRVTGVVDVVQRGSICRSTL